MSAEEAVITWYVTWYVLNIKKIIDYVLRLFVFSTSSVFFISNLIVNNQDRFEINLEIVTTKRDVEMTLNLLTKSQIDIRYLLTFNSR